MTAIRIIDSVWFTNRDGTTGIVMAEVPYEGVKYYIGHIRDASNSCEAEDAEYIATWGSTFPMEAGDSLFNNRHSKKRVP